MHAIDPNAAAAADGIYGLPFTPEQAKVVLIPVPWEATVSYGSGTADGPAAILEASRQVDLLDRETGKPYEAGIAMVEISAEVRAWSDEARRLAAPVLEAGGVGAGQPELLKAAAAVNALSEQMNAWVYKQAAHWLDQGKLIGIVGGDHSTPFGAIRAVAEHHPGVGVLHIDAHADLRNAYEGFTWSHASIMHNVATRLPAVSRLVQVGVRDYCEEENDLIEASHGRIRTYFDADMRRRLLDGDTWTSIARGIVADLPSVVYVSFDIDGLDPALCPHTGTPVLGGLSFSEASSILRSIVESGRRIVGFDLNEVAPDPQGRDQWDGNVGARVLYKQIGYALMSQRSH